jgi:hypothetical protein
MRSFSTLVKAVLSGATVPARWLVRGFLPGGTYGFSDGPDDITWNNGSGALSYRGFDQALKLSLPSVQAQNKTPAATISLSATDPVAMSSIFAAGYRGRVGEVALLINDPAIGAPGEELLIHRGRLDVATIEDQPAKPTDLKAPQVSTLSVTITPYTADLKRKGGRFATDADQRLFRDTNDGFFKDVALAGKSQQYWGKAGAQVPGAGTVTNQKGVAQTAVDMLFHRENL